MSAKIFTFEIPNRAGKQAHMTVVRDHLIQMGRSHDCADFVVERVGTIFDYYECGKPLLVARPDGEDQVLAERITLELEEQISPMMSGLISELVIAYTLIWELEGGE